MFCFVFSTIVSNVGTRFTQDPDVNFISLSSKKELIGLVLYHLDGARNHSKIRIQIDIPTILQDTKYLKRKPFARHKSLAIIKLNLLIATIDCKIYIHSSCIVHVCKEKYVLPYISI